MTAFTDLHPSTRRAVIRRLDMAADLIRQGWTQGASARDADGKEVDYDSPDATYWCLSGAIRHTISDMSLKGRGVVISTVMSVTYGMYGETPIGVNDDIARDRRTPLRVIRETKKRLEAQA